VAEQIAHLRERHAVLDQAGSQSDILWARDPQAPSKLLARVVQFGSDVLGERHQVGVALTPQEFRLLGLLALGYSYQAAGEELGISVNTVRNYIRSIYEKLHVHSKSEAVGKALRQHLID